MPIKKLIKLVSKYCDRIRHNGKHYVCYPKGIKRTITIASSSSDRNQYRQVFREFRRCGIIIKELTK